jgi:hypothetical protein
MDAHSTKIVEEAFKNDVDLQKRAIDASSKFHNVIGHEQTTYPSAEHLKNGIPELLRDISIFILSLPQSGQADTEPTAKKRKLEQSSQVPDRSLATENGSHEISGSPAVAFECKDVSFTSPLRKKLKLQFVHDAANSKIRQIRLLNQATNAVEYTVRGEDVDAMFCLSVPEKAQRQQSFIVFPRPGTQNQDGSTAEPLVWTMNETKVSPEIISTSTKKEEDTFVDVTRRELDAFMASLGKKTVLPDEREFASEIPQSHRKGEKAFHTKAFKGSKEGICPIYPFRDSNSPPNPKSNIFFLPPPRLPLPPLHRPSLRLQKARRLLPLRRNRKHLLHLGAAAHFQHRHHDHNLQRHLRRP